MKLINKYKINKYKYKINKYKYKIFKLMESYSSHCIIKQIKNFRQMYTFIDPIFFILMTLHRRLNTAKIYH